jgi:hypothetical protein
MRTKRFLLMLATVFVAGVALSACDEAEQGRILRYEKGTYLGPKDQVLSNEQQAELRARTRMQQ